MVRLIGSENRLKLIGFRALYVHYRYSAGYLPEEPPAAKQKTAALSLAGEDLLKLDAITAETGGCSWASNRHR